MESPIRAVRFNKVVWQSAPGLSAGEHENPTAAHESVPEVRSDYISMEEGTGLISGPPSGNKTNNGNSMAETEMMGITI